MVGIRYYAIILVLAGLVTGAWFALAGPGTQASTRPATTRSAVASESTDFFTGKPIRVTRPGAAGVKGKPVYVVQSSAESLRTRGLTPANWAHVQLYADRPTHRLGPRRSTDFAIIPLDNVRYMAKLTATGGTGPGWAPGVPDTPIFAGAPTFYDWEGQYTEANVATFEKYLRIAKETAPEVKIGLTVTPREKDFLLQEWAAGLTPEQVAEFRKGLAPYRQMLGLCDHASAGCYLSASDPATVARDLAGCRNMGKLIAAETRKPVYMWIRPTYGFGRDDGPDLSEADAKALLAMALEFDGAVIFSPDWATTKRVFVPLLGR